MSALSGLAMLSLRCVLIQKQFRSLFELSVLAVPVRLCLLPLCLYWPLPFFMIMLVVPRLTRCLVRLRGSGSP
jgi:hypothetical protein